MKKKWRLPTFLLARPRADDLRPSPNGKKRSEGHRKDTADIIPANGNAKIYIMGYYSPRGHVPMFSAIPIEEPG